MVEIAPASDVDKSKETHERIEVSEAATDHAEGDGFETASEGEIEGEQEEQNENSKKDSGCCDEQLPHKGDSYQDALNEEQLNQKALDQANNAKAEGNELFKVAQFDEALLKYEHALQLVPEIPSSVELRSICHANSAVCHLKMGHYKDTVDECTKAIELNPSYLKALARRGEAHEKLENFEEAVADMKKILELDPSNDQARRNLHRLEPLAAEKREKMKEEMIGKLKDMGNSLLGRFGMSLDNFKAVKDPNTGSYSISFQR